MTLWTADGYPGWSADGYPGWTADGGSFSSVPQPKGVPPSLGKPVTTRSFSWKDMVVRAWGSEYTAPDHRVYEFSGGRGFDSTDRGYTGFYRNPLSNYDLLLDENGNAINDEQSDINTVWIGGDP